MKQREDEPVINAEKSGTNAKSLLENRSQDPGGDQHRERRGATNPTNGTRQDYPAPTNTPEGWELVAVSERPRMTEVAPNTAAKPQSYVKAAAKNVR